MTKPKLNVHKKIVRITRNDILSPTNTDEGKSIIIYSDKYQHCSGRVISNLWTLNTSVYPTSLAGKKPCELNTNKKTRNRDIAVFGDKNYVMTVDFFSIAAFELPWRITPRSRVLVVRRKGIKCNKLFYYYGVCDETLYDIQWRSVQ